MTRLTFTLLLIVNLCFLWSCIDKDEALQNVCIQIAQNPDWNTEDIKSDYTIQFPDNYEGNGLIGFEGNTFSKTRVDKKIEFSHRFCSATYCYDFGLALKEPIPSSLVTEDKNRNELTLGSRKEFCSNNEIIGYFYFNEEESATGKYYMKRDSVYLEALTIYFSNIEIQEVENIIKTISQN